MKAYKNPHRRILERRRLRAWHLYQRGWRACDIATALGVSRPAVSQWLKAGKRDGEDGLASRRATGAPARLSARHRMMLTAMLRDTPSTYGLRDQRWTSTNVGVMIQRLFGVEYTPQHVARLMRAAKDSKELLPRMLRLELRDLVRDRTINELRTRITKR
jgi:transposase